MDKENEINLKKIKKSIKKKKKKELLLNTKKIN